MRPVGQIINLFPKTPVEVWQWNQKERCPFEDCVIKPRVSDNGQTRWVIKTHLGEENLSEGAFIVKKGAGAFFVMNEQQIAAEYTMVTDVDARILSLYLNPASGKRQAVAC